MEFRLLFEGELKPSGGAKSRAPEKHEIRRVFHPQLRRLWLSHPGLRQLAEHHGRSAFANEMGTGRLDAQVSMTTETSIAKGFEVMGKDWSRGGYQCVPLVTEKHSLRCGLDIVLLRPEEDRFIFKQGDIDGQVKTIFDALKIPANLGEAGGQEPQEDETPFFCLLEDDRLISEVKVLTDRLLLLPNAKELKANDSFAIITVQINQRTPGPFDSWFR